MYKSIRPKNLDEFIGQENIKKSLRIFIDSTKTRDEALDHTLF